MARRVEASTGSWVYSALTSVTVKPASCSGGTDLGIVVEVLPVHLAEGVAFTSIDLDPGVAGAIGAVDDAADHEFVAGRFAGDDGLDSVNSIMATV